MSKIAALLPLMLKTAGLFDMSKPEIKNGNNKVDRYSVNGSNKKLAKKLGKLFMFRKLSKSRKKWLKYENSLNFEAIESEESYLTSDARTAFNHIWQTFIKAPIL